MVSGEGIVAPNGDAADEEDSVTRRASAGDDRSPPTEKGPSQSRRGKVSDDELVRRRQEVKSLKDQIAARHTRVSSSVPGGPSFSMNSTRDAANSPPSSMSPFSLVREQQSPRQGGGRPTLSPDSTRDKTTPILYARRGHFDASSVPRQHDSVEMESLRGKMGAMEAKLLQTQSQLIKERESTRTAKARLAMEMQTRITSEEQELLRSNTLLEQQLAEFQEGFAKAKADLDTEKKERQLCEVEIDRLNRSIERSSLVLSQQPSFVQKGSPEEHGEARDTEVGIHVRKIQELCQVNLTLVAQKRSTVKHVVAMATEISDISWLMSECIDQIKASSSTEEADVMLATENKALLMAQLQAQSKLQLLEAELLACQKELAEARAQLTSPWPNSNGALSVQQSIDENVADVEGKTRRLEEELSALKKTHAEVMVKWTARIRESEVQADKLGKALQQERERSTVQLADLQDELRALQQERERSTVQLADLQDELNSVHQSRMSESAKHDNDHMDNFLSPETKKPSRSAPQASRAAPSETSGKYSAESSGHDFVPLLTLCDEDAAFSAVNLRQHHPEVLSIKLNMSIAEIENSVQFVQTVKSDLCSALGISASRMQVHGLRAGSVLVDLAVLEGAAESDRPPSEILMEILRQMKDPSSELMHGSTTSKTISVEIHRDEGTFEGSIKSLTKPHDTSDANDSSSSTNWIELVEQQTVQLRRQTADLVEAEHLNRKLIANMEEKEESSKAIRQALETREAEASLLQISMDDLSEKLRQAEMDASNWKRAFSNLESQLNEHNALIKKHLSVSEARADGLQLEKQKLAAELSDVTEKYMRASQDSYRSVESAGSVGIIPDVLPTPASQMTRGAPPPLPTRASPSPSTAPPDASGSADHMVQYASSEPAAAGNSAQSTVDVTLKLALNCGESFRDHPGGRGGFETQLKHELAHASGLAHTNFVIRRLEADSPLVDLAIFSNLSGRDPEALATAIDLEQQARDPSSLLKSSTILRHVQEVTIRSPAHEEYKLTREDNQRLREQVQNLRSQVLKLEGEIEERCAKIGELEWQLSEHLRMAKAMQAQVEKSISQLHEAQRSNKELAARLSNASSDLEVAQSARDESATMVEKLGHMNEELEARLREARHHEKASEEKDEALRRLLGRLGQVETELSKLQADSKDRQNEAHHEQKSEEQKFSDANKQIHDLQVQGVQLAQTKVYLEEKIDRLTEMHDKEKEGLARNLKDSRAQLAEREAQCAANAQREEELNKKINEQGLALQGLEASIEEASRPDSERKREDVRRDQSIAALEARLNQMRSELKQRDIQVSKLQEALMTTRSMAAKSKSSPRFHTETRMRDESSPSNSLNSSPLDSEANSPGRIMPFGEAFSLSASSVTSALPEDVEASSMPTAFQARAQRSSPPPAPHTGSPISSPPAWPWDVDTCKGSTQASRGSLISPAESLMASFATIGNQDSAFVRGSGARSVSPQPSSPSHLARIPLPDAKPTFPASKQISLFQTKPTYQGELKDGWPHGRGITVWPDGRVYDGHWRKGVFQGKGTCIWSNGDIYEGEWEEGFANGLGIYSFAATGDIFEGTFRQDKFHGYGVLSTGASTKFRGSWDDGLLNGWALVICKNGDKMKNHFEKGIPNEGQQSMSDDLYGSTLMAVSGVVKSVREQTAHIRQMRAAGPDSHVQQSPGGYIPTPNSVYNLATPPPRPANSPINLNAGLTPNLQRSELIPVDAMGTLVGRSAYTRDTRG